MKHKGKELVAEVDATDISTDMAGIWWLGQHSFIVKLGAKIIYIDPFLSDHGKRLIPPLLKPEEITNADLIIGSHDHRDHIDREMWPTISKASPKALFVVPEFHRTALASDLGIPLERFVGMNDGEEKTVSGISVSAVASAHEFLDRDESSGLYPFLGFVLQGNGITLYHSGDTCIYEGLQTKLSKWAFDVIMLPINGRDAKRLSSGCLGNMTYQEAADLAGALSPGITIPAHFEMFPNNLENPQLFLDYMRVKYPHLKTKLCEHGEMEKARSGERRAKSEEQGAQSRERGVGSGERRAKSAEQGVGSGERRAESSEQGVGSREKAEIRDIRRDAGG